MPPQELKASILQLSIQGKLVEQRTEEGSGWELIEKILATKDTKKNSRASARLSPRIPRAAKRESAKRMP